MKDEIVNPPYRTFLKEISALEVYLDHTWISEHRHLYFAQEGS